MVLDAKKLESDVPRSIRLVKPKDNQGGEWMYVVEGVGYWINRKFYRSPASLGKKCPIAEEIEKAKSLGSSEIDKLLKDWKSFSRDYALYMPIVPIKVDIDLDTGEVSSVIVDGTERVLKAPVSMADDIQKIVTNPNTVAGSKGAGVFHQELGFSISLLKTGQGIDTRYSASLDPQRVPLEDKDYEPYDIVGMFKKEMRSESEMRNAIRSYLYGEEYEEESPTSDLEEEPKKAPQPKKAPKKEAKSMEDDDDMDVLDFDEMDDTDTLEYALSEDLDDLDDL